MSNLKQYHIDQMNGKRGTEMGVKSNRKTFAHEVEIHNDLVNVKNELKRRSMNRADEINRDTIGNEQRSQEFNYYKKFMHSGIDKGRNANLVKKYIKLNYNE